MERRAGAVRALLFAILLFFCCGETPFAADRDSAASELRIAVSEFPKRLFLIGTPLTTGAAYVRGFVGRSLTIYDKSWAVACSLCAELPTFENHGAEIVTRADGTKGVDVVFELDPGLAWDDGVAVTTQDVLFSIEVAHRFGGSSSALPNILDAVALDEHRVKLRIASVRYDYNRMDDLFLLPAHIEKPIFDAANSLEEYKAHSLYTVEPAAAGLAYGPYKVTQFSPSEIALTRNPYWRGKRPSFDRIVLRKFTDFASVSDALAQKQVDMVSGESGLDLPGIYRIEAADQKSSYNFIYKSTLKYMHIDLNLSNELLKDKRIRRALLLSLDRPIVRDEQDQAASGGAPRSFLVPTSPNFDPTIPPAPFDPAQADALFTAAGFERGADGIRVDARGRRLAFRLAAELDWDTNKRIAEVIAAQLRKAGVDVTVEDQRMSEILPKRQFDLAFYVWFNVPEFPLEPVYARSGIPTAENGYRGLNFPGFDNDEMNKVAESLNTELNPAKRLLLWRRAQQIYAEELPALPLGFGLTEYIVPANMTGVEPTGHMIPTSYWVEDWQMH